MKKATNEAEVIENFKEFVSRVNELYNEFFENSQADKYYYPVIMEDLHFEKLADEGFSMWKETKANFIEIDFGIYFGLCHIISNGAISLGD